MENDNIDSTIMPTWICPKCGKENDGNFCSSCGTPRPKGSTEPAESSLGSGPTEISSNFNNASSDSSNVIKNSESSKYSAQDSHSLKSDDDIYNGANNAITKSTSKPKVVKETKPKKNKMLILILAVLAIIAVVIIVRVVSGTKTVDYNDNEYTTNNFFNDCVSVDIPNTLTKDSSNSTDDSIIFLSKDNSFDVHIELYKADGLTEDTVDDMNETFISGLKKGNDLTVSKLHVSTISNIDSEVFSGTVTDENSTELNYSYALIPLSNYYVAVYSRWPIENKVDFTKVASHIINSISIDESVTIKYASEKAIVSIASTYDGSTDAGTVLDSSNTGIHVTATLADGSTQEINDWAITTPQTLVAGQTSTVTITYDSLNSDLAVTCTTVDPVAYKASCQSISYDELARYPDKYSGQNIKIYGQVLQVMEGSDNSVELRVATQKSEYGDSYYDDVVYVEYTYTEDRKSTRLNSSH